MTFMNLTSIEDYI